MAVSGSYQLPNRLDSNAYKELSVAFIDADRSDENVHLLEEWVFVASTG